MQLWLDDDVVSAQNKVGSLVVGGLCPPALPSTVSGQLSIQTPVCIVSLPTAPILRTTRRSLAPFSGLSLPVDTRLEGVQLEDAFFQLFTEAFEQLSKQTPRLKFACGLRYITSSDDNLGHSPTEGGILYDARIILASFLTPSE